MTDTTIYKVIFHNQGEVYEIYARSVSQGGLFGFVEVEEIVFGEKNQVVVDPSEERLKSELEGVTRTYLPLHSIVRVDEVEKEGAARITARQKGDANLMLFPTPGIKSDS